MLIIIMCRKYRHDIIYNASFTFLYYRGFTELDRIGFNAIGGYIIQSSDLSHISFSIAFCVYFLFLVLGHFYATSN
jgi:hypothetical protein